MPRFRRFAPILAAAVLGAALTAAALTVPAWADSSSPGQAQSDGPTVTLHLPATPTDGPVAAAVDCLRSEGIDLSGNTDIEVTEDTVTINGKQVDAAWLKRVGLACAPEMLGASGLDLGALGGLGGLGDLGALGEQLGELFGPATRPSSDDSI